MSDQIPTTKLRCPYGFNGTQEQLLNALRLHPTREGASSHHVKDTAAWLIEFKDAENDRLRAEIDELRKQLADWEVYAVNV